jgi:beta-galactosidase
MWIHEGHIAALKNFPQLLFTSAWQLFDIAVQNRNEGYLKCLDGKYVTIDDNLRRLNDKGLVERDHITKKDTFYLYKAWWNPTPFIHICGKDFNKVDNRVIKCYTNEVGQISLKVNGTVIETATPVNNILEFSPYTFNDGDLITVEGQTQDSFTI